MSSLILLPNSEFRSTFTCANKNFCSFGKGFMHVSILFYDPIDSDKALNWMLPLRQWKQLDELTITFFKSCAAIVVALFSLYLSCVLRHYVIDCKSTSRYHCSLCCSPFFSVLLFPSRVHKQIVFGCTRGYCFRRRNVWVLICFSIFW